ncbi:Translation elongation factor eEF3 [Chondrus crispus]|uniref:Elongation factor 3 n=1 Tax=Chondrus crispus TaxID=2769 RepID=R7QBG8_CHOCR|nr:Translation elongation factor eEF3 [Chondrus crispus]CDF35118.1 Translation elongation factor eEF3 [Chondrus crispus]|eukprot:XP_005714937.1 Translation elongation factor eEF3 [Chondrus crispus]
MSKIAAPSVSFKEPASDASVKTAFDTAITATNRAEAATAFVADNCATIACAHPASGLTDALATILSTSDKKKAAQREVALFILERLVAKYASAVAPYVTHLLAHVLTLMADKNSKNVQNISGRVATAIVDMLNPVAKRAVCLSTLVNGLSLQAKWQTQAGALGLITKVATDAPHEIGSCMPDLVPAVAPLMCESRAALSEGSKRAMAKMCEGIDNPDVKPLVPHLMSALGNPIEVEDAIYKLAATTFVAQIECNALAITVPLLKRAFQTRSTPLKRISAKIITNMAKLVERPSDVEPFIPTLMPALKRASDEISDPEARAVCAEGVEVLDGASKGEGMAPEPRRVQRDTVLKTLEESIGGAAGTTGPMFEAALDFICKEVTVLISNQALEIEEWNDMLSRCTKYMTIVDEEEEEEDAEELCRCKFSLAYGSKVLLNNTDLRLKRGFRYGLLGPNECGKTTLMRAIANGQVEGFPPPDEVKTVFVEADILGELSHLNVLDYIFADEAIRACDIPRETIQNVLSSVGFTKLMVEGSVSFLSGGWRMKLALARAMLQNADILLLDEPTNHLDVINVKWVEDYLNNLKDVTSIIVSHDKGLLNNCCTHIIQIENLKLKLHKGNLTEFVKKVPKARTYFELKETKLKFKFPKPGNLDGITSKGKAIIKMDNVIFTYPSASRPQIAGVTIRCSLASRVACIGPNGAGKSTIVKLLTGELEPDSGNVWKHANARIGYIAQHAFHHIENHLEKTPNEYIRWRYAYGEDREALQKDTMQVSDEELKLMKTPVSYVWISEDEKEHREKLKVDRLTSQRRTKKGTKNDYEYEVKWEGKPTTWTAWLSLDKLESMGWGKAIKSVDEKVASRASAFTMPLTAANVETHLENVGLNREFGTHCRLGALSGGQKVKVALAASLWNCPHLIVLDEPTNYLDRESLVALTYAIKAFEGGVVIISHNSEFTGEVCPEVWNLTPATETEPARLNLEGDLDWTKNAEKDKIEVKQITETTDAYGNTVKVKARRTKKKMSRQEKKKLDRKRAAQKASGEYYEGINGTDSEEGF